MNYLVEQGLGIAQGVGQAGQRRGVVGPRAAGRAAPVDQRRGVVDDEEPAPGMVEEVLGRGAGDGGTQGGGVAVAAEGDQCLQGVALK
ncbi:hypothetical protein ACIBAH_32645 [Streptomyces sp. NPDC051445]|uniref:hypothetical protein n=1 Tax=Streptomyces sp. NPDC051445 TaxID=3365653 RepID=UPI0037A9E62D